jgi:putative hemolysin
MELLILVLLTILNGVFSMSEAAIIASRKARLQQMIEKGDAGAETALKLSEDPNTFLSAIQIGITLIGILSGAFGGATIAGQIATALKDTPLAPYAEAVGFGLIVVVTAYLSLIIGELVPKRLALQSPERIASVIARPMQIVSIITAPIVKLLSASTNIVLFLLGARKSDEPPVSEEEIKAMIQEGIEAGVFEESEHDMVEGIFRLGDRRISTLMTPRPDVTWLNLEDTPEENRAKIIASNYSRFPVCDGDPDHVVGLLQTKDLLSSVLAGGQFDLKQVMQEPLFVPESVSASKVLDMFRESATHIALVIDEYGGFKGLVTIQDILEEIVGDVEEEEQPIQRADGSWLLDGMTSVDDFKELLDIDEIPGENDDFETLGGFIMMQQGKIPEAGESFEWRSFRFEVMDMDGNRVDKVLVTAVTPPTEASNETPSTDGKKDN